MKKQENKQPPSTEPVKTDAERAARQVLSKQELINKRDECRAMAQQFRFDAAANDGAAQAYEQLLVEMEETAREIPPENK